MKKKSRLFILWRVILYIKERDTFTFFCLGRIQQARRLSGLSPRLAFSVSSATLDRGQGKGKEVTGELTGNIQEEQQSANVYVAEYSSLFVINNNAYKKRQKNESADRDSAPPYAGTSRFRRGGGTARAT
jgi:hypothetical protein